MTAVTVKEIPEDIAKFLFKIQGELKAQRGVGKYSQSKTILHIIKEYKKIIEKC